MRRPESGNPSFSIGMSGRPGSLNRLSAVRPTGWIGSVPPAGVPSRSGC